MVNGDIYLQEKLRELERDRRHGRQVVEARRLAPAGGNGNGAIGAVRAAIASVASFFKHDEEVLADETPSGRTQGRDGGRHAAHPDAGAPPVLPDIVVP